MIIQLWILRILTCCDTWLDHNTKHDDALSCPTERRHEILIKWPRPEFDNRLQLLNNLNVHRSPSPELQMSHQIKSYPVSSRYVPTKNVNLRALRVNGTQRLHLHKSLYHPGFEPFVVICVQYITARNIPDVGRMARTDRILSDAQIRDDTIWAQLCHDGN